MAKVYVSSRRADTDWTFWVYFLGGQVDCRREVVTNLGPGMNGSRWTPGREVVSGMRTYSLYFMGRLTSSRLLIWSWRVGAGMLLIFGMGWLLQLAL